MILSCNTVDEIYTPSEYLAAITDCNLGVFSRRDWKGISETIIGWDRILQQIIAKYQSGKIAGRSGLVS